MSKQDLTEAERKQIFREEVERNAKFMQLLKGFGITKEQAFAIFEKKLRGMGMLDD
jgi:hypothetical protein